MKKIIYTIAISLGILVGMQAQERSIYSQAHLYPILINPALSGNSGNHDLLFNYKSSFTTWPGAPKSFTFSYDGLVADRVGLGALIFSDRAGQMQNYRAQLSYAYKFEVNDFKMSVGLSTEFLQNRLANGALLDPFTEQGDDLIIEAADGIQFFDATLGFYGDYQDRLFVGLSVPSLIRTRIDQVTTIQGDQDNTFLQYFTLLLGHRFNIEQYNFKVIPSILIRRLREAPFAADLNVMLSFLDDQLIGGLTYSVSGASKAAFLLGTKLNNFRLTYSYDIGFTGAQNYHNGGHEISVGISIEKVPKRVKIDDTEIDE